MIDGCFQAWLVFAFGVGVEYIGCFLESSYFFHGFQHFGFGINFVHKKGTSPTAYSLENQVSWQMMMAAWRHSNW